MNRKEQERFVRDLTGAIRDEVVAQIRAGRTPEEWDGFELRWLLAYRFEQATLATRKTHRRRYRDFDNHVIVANL